ncbi:15-hydroxyprostaglandin dehydrogenase [Calycina marina]|uniref:15-hydroxyprostaglandin dehydrogenase n=1 Tax=Calycina marina TaxID=1763456 RepID=A0A9P7YV53_9HELO|nr:15-hydroxyprostaglandin dehydrogenase [Calycina marina]
MTTAMKKVAMVTGAASAMGDALDTHLISKGSWYVACLDLQRGPGEALAKSLAPDAHFWEANVADYDSQARMFQEVFSRWGRIDALLANAGIVDRSSLYILDHRGSNVIPPAPNLACIHVDYKGVVYGKQLAIHFMRKNPTPGGNIVATATVINFCRGIAPVLKLKDNITVNTVLPGIVPTRIIPQAMLAAVAPDYLTPISTIVMAYDRFLSNDNFETGLAIERSVDKLYTIPQTEYINGRASARACQVWEPLFKIMHSENSRLEDAIP